MAKNRVHNEYFRPVMKRTCPCGQKKTQVYSWGEYVIARWRTVDHFCEKCFPTKVLPRLVSHMGNCGCSFELVWKGGFFSTKPEWLKMPDATCTPKKEEERKFTPVEQKESNSKLMELLAASPWEQMQNNANPHA